MEVRPGYKQTEVGCIPEEWDARALGEGITLLSGHHVFAQHCNTRGVGVPYLTGPADFPDGAIAHAKFTESPSTQCQADDLLVTVKGSGSGALVIADDVYCISRQLMAIRVREWDTRFIYYSLLQNASQIKAASTGLIPGLARSDILEQILPLPSLPEQRAIAAALSDVDALLGGLDRLIAKKRDLKQAAMQQLLTGQTRLPGFRGDWEVKLLEQVAGVKTGPFGSTLHESDYVQDGTPIITVEHLGEFGVIHRGLPLVSDADRQRLRAYSLQIGDIVFSRVGSVDRNALISPAEEGWLFSGRLLRIRPDAQRINAKFLSYQFHGERFLSSIRAVAVGQTMASLNTRILNSIAVILPTISEQDAIAEILFDMDAELTAIETRRDKTRDLKQAIMQELLTGNTRLVSTGGTHV